MVHYLLFGRQIVNNNQSKDQWDSQEKKNKNKKNTALITKGNKGSFKKHNRLEEN